MSDQLPDLERLPLDSFEQVVMNGSLRVVADVENPIRLNLFAAGIRELFTHALHRLAPDSEVTRCKWYEPEPNTKGPTRRQRAKYATQGGLPDEFIEEAGVDVNDLHSEAIKAVDRLSKYTHVRPGSLVSDQAEIDAFVQEALATLIGLFASFDECRSKVLDTVFSQIDEEVVSAFISETIGSLDEIATHHCIDDVCIEDLTVAAITHDVIKFMVSGSLGVELQWGSSSDFRRGDGVAIDKSFPFCVTMWSSVDDVTSFEDVNYSVDTDSWWDGYYDDDE